MQIYKKKIAFGVRKNWKCKCYLSIKRCKFLGTQQGLLNAVAIECTYFFSSYLYKDKMTAPMEQKH